MMIQSGYSTHFGFCDICKCLFMSKPGFCSGWSVYTSLQLLEIVCWCRGFSSLLISWLALLLLVACAWSTPWFVSQQETVPCLSCSWMKFWLCVLPVLSVLVFWWLTNLPADEWARVCFWKAYMWCSLALPGRQLLLVTLVTHCVCVQHAHSPVSRLCVCVGRCCAPEPGTWLWHGSARPLWSYLLISHFYLISNLPSGKATWLNSVFALICAGNQQLIQKWIWSSSNPRSSEDDLVVFSLGSLLVLFFSFSCIVSISPILVMCCNIHLFPLWIL
jgi:hypothetical protein